MTSRENDLLIDTRGRGRGFVSGSSIAGKWSRHNLCDIVTKASAAFVASTALDVHFYGAANRTNRSVWPLK